MVGVAEKDEASFIAMGVGVVVLKLWLSIVCMMIWSVLLIVGMCCFLGWVFGLDNGVE